MLSVRRYATSAITGSNQAISRKNLGLRTLARSAARHGDPPHCPRRGVPLAIKSQETDGGHFLPRLGNLGARPGQANSRRPTICADDLALGLAVIVRRSIGLFFDCETPETPDLSKEWEAIGLERRAAALLEAHRRLWEELAEGLAAGGPKPGEAPYQYLFKEGGEW